MLGRAIGNLVVSPIVDVLDVNGVAQRIDLEEALNRVDLNALLDRIDVDRVLARVDLDALLDRVDVDRLVERSNIGAIVARSSASVGDVLLDNARCQLVKADQYIQRLGRCACCFSEPRELPPLPPGRARRIHRRKKQRKKRRVNRNGNTENDEDADDALWTTQSLQLALNVQGRYAGILAQSVADFLDNLILLLVFSVIVLLVQTLVNRITGRETFDAEADWVWFPVLFFSWSFLYTAGSLAATGRTIGLLVCGLHVINNGDGRRIRPLQALIRTLLEPFSALTIVGTLIGWFRRDGRQLHDLLCSSAVVYSWDAKLAHLRQHAMAMEESVKEQDA